MTRHTYIGSRLGQLLLVATADAIAGLYFEDHRPQPNGIEPGARVARGTEPLLRDAADQVDAYLDGDLTSFGVPTLMKGTPFQLRTWAIMATVSYGTTTTYGAVARQLGNAGLARAAGVAIGRNPLCILTPCHRVLGAGGTLVGYAGGLERKRALLALEDSR